MKRLSYKITASALIFLGLLTSVEAQITPIDYINQAGRYTIRSRVPMDIMIPYEPYLFLEERDARIELVDSTIVRGFYRYNVENETLEHSTSEKVYNLKEVKRFWFSENSKYPEEYFVNIKLIWPQSEYGGFFENISNSEFVWIKYFLEFKPKDYDPVMDVGNPYDRVEMAKEFYFKLNNVWTTLPQTKSKLYDVMAPYVDQGDLKKFMRKEKIKLDVPEDVGRLINWIAKSEN